LGHLGLLRETFTLLTAAQKNPPSINLTSTTIECNMGIRIALSVQCLDRSWLHSWHFAAFSSVVMPKQLCPQEQRNWGVKLTDHSPSMSSSAEIARRYTSTPQFVLCWRSQSIRRTLHILCLFAYRPNDFSSVRYNHHHGFLSRSYVYAPKIERRKRGC